VFAEHEAPVLLAAPQTRYALPVYAHVKVHPNMISGFARAAQGPKAGQP
jgi:hypothetical protein